MIVSFGLRIPIKTAAFISVNYAFMSMLVIFLFCCYAFFMKNEYDLWEGICIILPHLKAVHHVSKFTTLVIFCQNRLFRWWQLAIVLHDATPPMYSTPRGKNLETATNLQWEKNSTNLISLNLCYITPRSNGEQVFVVSISGHESQMWNDLSLIDCLARSKHYAAMKA